MNSRRPLIQHEIDTQSSSAKWCNACARPTGAAGRSPVLATASVAAAADASAWRYSFGNTYLLPQGSAGLLDWQLSVRGYCMHDVSYLLVTSLPIALRREHERSLLDRYRERLNRPRRQECADCRTPLGRIPPCRRLGRVCRMVDDAGRELRLGDQRRQSSAPDDGLRGPGHGAAR